MRGGYDRGLGTGCRAGAYRVPDDPQRVEQGGELVGVEPAGEPLVDQLDVLGEYLAHVHVKNVAWHRTGTRPDGSTRWMPDWAPLREGQADLGAYLAALAAHGYDGWVTVEDFSTAVALEERTRDNLDYLRSLTG